MTQSEKPRPQPGLLDLSQFASVADAVAQIAPAQRYVEVGKRLGLIGADIPLSTLWMFWLSMLSRAEGLHGAIAREVKEHNPHAVFPLIRAFAEAVVLVIYVADHPTYVETLTVREREIPKGAPKRRSMQALISHASRVAPGMKAVYEDLSEVAHFGAAAMWTAHRVDLEEQLLRWTSDPAWKSDEQALIACAQTLELAEAMEVALHNLAVRHILPTARRRPKRA